MQLYAIGKHVLNSAYKRIDKAIPSYLGPISFHSIDGISS